MVQPSRTFQEAIPHCRIQHDRKIHTGCHRPDTVGLFSKTQFHGAAPTEGYRPRSGGPYNKAGACATGIEPQMIQKQPPFIILKQKKLCRFPISGKCVLNKCRLPGYLSGWPIRLRRRGTPMRARAGSLVSVHLCGVAAKGLSHCGEQFVCKWIFLSRTEAALQCLGNDRG